MSIEIRTSWMLAVAGAIVGVLLWWQKPAWLHVPEALVTFHEFMKAGESGRGRSLATPQIMATEPPHVAARVEAAPETSEETSTDSASPQTSVVAGTSSSDDLKEETPAEASGETREAELILKVKMPYSVEGLLAGYHGVTLTGVVAIDGTVGSIKVVDGAPMLRQAAVEAFSKWRYKPALLKGVPIPSEVRVYVPNGVL